LNAIHELPSSTLSATTRHAILTDFIQAPLDITRIIMKRLYELPQPYGTRIVELDRAFLAAADAQSSQLLRHLCERVLDSCTTADMELRTVHSLETAHLPDRQRLSDRIREDLARMTTPAHARRSVPPLPPWQPTAASPSPVASLTSHDLDMTDEASYTEFSHAPSIMSLRSPITPVAPSSAPFPFVTRSATLAHPASSPSSTASTGSMASPPDAALLARRPKKPVLNVTRAGARPSSMPTATVANATIAPADGAPTYTPSPMPTSMHTPTAAHAPAATQIARAVPTVPSIFD
jgi:hypothetical protein